jgi:nitroreductase
VGAVTEDMTAQELLTTTRAVRRRLDLDRPVPLSLVRECIDIAVQAPSGRNGQRWRWVVVDDPERKRGLAEIWRDTYAGPRAPVTENEALRRIMASSDHLAEVMHRVPVLVIPCLLDRPPVERGPHALADFYGSGLPAVWSFMLAARLHGLGTAMTTQHLAKEKAAAALLGIPPTVTQLALIPVAFTIGDTFRPAPRRPVDEIIYRNTWRARQGADQVSAADGG